MLWAVLGTIEFLALGSPTAFVSERTFDYAKHKLVETRPQLQWVSDDLETIGLDMIFHVMYARPKTMYETLLAAARDHNARALVFGNGDHRGYYVITNLNETFIQNADDGSRIAIQVHVDLEEVVPLPPDLTNPITGQHAGGQNILTIDTTPTTGVQQAIFPGSAAPTPYNPSSGTLTGTAPASLPTTGSAGPPTIFSALTYGAPGVSGMIAPAPPTGPPSASSVYTNVPVSSVVRAAP